MGEKRYQISPIELVQWAEPLFGEEGEAAKGFSEDLVSAYEASAGFKLPAALRGYLLACGRASLNDMLHPMHIPDKDAKPFGGNLTFSHDYIEGDMLGFREHNETGSEEEERLWALPRERWEERLDNYLLFWHENRAAGMRESGNRIWGSPTQWCISTTRIPCTTGFLWQIPFPPLSCPSS